MKPPLVSVITPTWQRHDMLLSRCIPSVQGQGYKHVEHIIVSDGPDENLRDFAGRWKPSHHPGRVTELPVHDPEPHYGVRARLRGLELADGEYITYCDDDDALRPGHCKLMAAALDADPGAGFAVSRMAAHTASGWSVTGWGKLECGNVGSPMIMHRRETPGHGTWAEAGPYEDWDLVRRWLEAGVRYVNVDAETSDVWPHHWHHVTADQVQCRPCPGRDCPRCNGSGVVTVPGVPVEKVEHP